ncbi:MAG: MFS transporter [Oscillospiraceae bacterium]|nr:MFS transporter [Oscillospiraceae bacterium]
MSKTTVTYKRTIAACYAGNITMAAIINFLPLLFVTLRAQFGLTYGQLGLLTLINFTTQVAMDFACGPLVDRYGFRRFILSSAVLTVAGFGLFAVSPWITDRPYPLFVLATVIFSGSCGLLELLLSPIVNSVPTDEKTKAMSGLHAFYCWGTIIVVLVSTVLLRLFGHDKWQYIMLMWLLMPVADFFMFLKAPLEPPAPEEQRQSFRQFSRKAPYILLCVIILCGAATEIAMGQWISAFVERGVGVSKLVGDTAGVCVFALMMGIGRVILGKKGEREGFNMNRVLLLSFAVSVVCYVAAALTDIKLLTLMSCAVLGLVVSVLWPGSLIAATKLYPKAGAWMFAVMSGFGDIGCAFAPWVAGKVIDGAQTVPALMDYCARTGLELERLGLKAGILASAVFPLAGIVATVVMMRETKKLKIEN